MPETSEIFKALRGEVDNREWRKGQTEIDRLTNLYEGELPQEYERYFPNQRPKHVVNLIRLAWDDLATDIGRIPELTAPTLNASQTEKDRSALIEHIGYSYAYYSEPSAEQMYWLLGWWLIGTGRAVIHVKPHPERPTPIFSVKDPRHAYPGVKRKAGNQIVELSDVIFHYKLPRSQMRRMGLKIAPKTGVSVPGRPTFGGESEKTEGEVIEWVTDKTWMVASDGGTVKSTQHDLGKVPAFVFQTHSPNLDQGLSQFHDQVTLQVAISRLISQKLAFGDRVVYPLYWVRGYQGDLEIGPMSLVQLEEGGEMGQLAPPSALQADRDIELLTTFSRILNRNPAVRQGEVQSKGEYVASKTLETLAEQVDRTVERAWNIVRVGKRHLYACAYQMDEKLWPNERKKIRGTIQNLRFDESYVPSEDVNGRWEVDVDYGFGLGGYTGFLQHMQAEAAGLMPKRRVIENMPGVHDPDSLIKEIELENMDEAGNALFMALAESGQLDMPLWSDIRKSMAEEGWRLHRAIEEYREALQEQAQAATQGEGQGPAPLATPPAPAGPEGAAGPLPGLPPVVG